MQKEGNMQEKESTAMQNMTLAQAREKAQEILEEARAQAAQIVRSAQNAPARTAVPITQEANVQEVEIELFADSGSYAEPLAVKWGGRQFLIPRGVRVRVPIPVAQIIRISQMQDHKAAALIHRLERSIPR